MTIKIMGFRWLHWLFVSKDMFVYCRI